MKVYRGAKDTCTDSKKPDEYLLEWEKPGDKIELRVTIKDRPDRRSYILLEIEEKDIVALFFAFLKANPQRLFELLSDHLKV
jgi:hypothetical protein